MMIIIIIII